MLGQAIVQALGDGGLTRSARRSCRWTRRSFSARSISRPWPAPLRRQPADRDRRHLRSDASPRSSSSPLAANAAITLHVRSFAGENSHHIIEAAFESRRGWALRQAVAVDAPGSPVCRAPRAACSGHALGEHPVLTQASAARVVMRATGAPGADFPACRTARGMFTQRVTENRSRDGVIIDYRMGNLRSVQKGFDQGSPTPW